MSGLILELSILTAAVVAGLAAWLSLALANNVLDFSTNRHLLSNVMTMAELKADGQLGHGRLRRAVGGVTYPALILKVVIAAQGLIASLLWRGAWHLALSGDRHFAVGAANLGLAGFMDLWLWFLTGGLF